MNRPASKIRTAKEPQVSKFNSTFDRVVDAFAKDNKVSLGGKKGFGSGALKVNGKIFAMMSSKGEFVVKLPKARVDELVASGKGQRFDPGRGRLMKEWVVVRTGTKKWAELASKACDFVKRGK
jgi:hypothetical protein